MDSSGVQIQLDPVAPPETPKSREKTPKSRETAPGRKRDERDDSRDASVVALTASFAEILQSKKLTHKAHAEVQTKGGSAETTRQNGRSMEETLQAAKKQPAAGKRISADVQARETLDHAKDLAGQAVKAARASGSGAAAQGVALPVEAAKKGDLTRAEEALLRELILNNGRVAGQKRAPQRTGFVQGEALNRGEGINAVKSMTAKEGEVLKNLSGGEAAAAPQKPRSAKPAKPQQDFFAPEPSVSEGKASPAAPSVEAMKDAGAGQAETQQDKPAEAGPAKKLSASKGSGTESRDPIAAPGERSAYALGKASGGLAAAKPQAVMSQVLDGAAQMLRDGSGRVVLTLQPPRLGTLDLDVVVQDNRVKMVMLADNQEVKQLLQAGMDDLRNALQDKGFEIDRMDVLVQNRPDQGGSDFWQEAGFARGDASKAERQKTKQDEGPDARGTPIRHVRTGDSGLSVFA